MRQRDLVLKSATTGLYLTSAEGDTICPVEPGAAAFRGTPALSTGERGQHFGRRGDRGIDIGVAMNGRNEAGFEL